MNPGVLAKLNSFFGKYKSKNYKTGETILGPNEEIFNIYFLKTGFVGQYFFTENGNKIAVHIFKSGSFFPIMLVLAESENKYDFQAITQVEVLEAPTTEVMKFVQENEDIKSDLLVRLAFGLNGLSERLTHQMFADRYKRVVSILVWLARSFGEKNGEKVVIKFPISHDDIASWINLARETTSRQIETLESKKLIEYENHHITIPHLSMLEAEIA